MTCNGGSKTPWSKTMVGVQDHTEDKWFCLELTYNYGVTSYSKDTGFHSFGVAVDDPNSCLEKAKALGYEVQPGSIVGPDSYVYSLQPWTAVKGFGAFAERAEPFSIVNLRCDADKVVALKEFYVNTCKLQDLTDEFAKSPLLITGQTPALVIGYPTLPTTADHVPIAFYVKDGADAGDGGMEGSVKLADRSGRLAFSYEGVEGTYNEIVGKFGEGAVIHKHRILKDQLGDLEIAIVRDPQGYEVCLVTNTVFDAAAKAAADWKDPDWDFRKEKGGV